MNTNGELRFEFGQELRRCRSAAGLSLRVLGARAGLPHTMIAAIEAGDKTVGPGVAEKLATALNLAGQDQDQFLLRAAQTRKRDKLMLCSRELDARIVNYVPRALAATGLDLSTIDTTELARGDSGERLLIRLKDGRQVQCELSIRNN
jgi:transcriptional regulator with XRE-family HTH domain